MGKMKSMQLIVSALMIASLLWALTIPLASALTDVSAEPEDPLPGVTTIYTIEFTTEYVIPAGGRMEIVFPPEYTLVAQPDTFEAETDPEYGGTFSYSVDPSARTATIALDADHSLPVATVVITLSDVTNPTIAGDYTITIATYDDAGLEIESATAVVTIDPYTQGLIGTWSDGTISVYIHATAAWIDPDWVDAAEEAVSLWNDAIDQFVDYWTGPGTFQDYSYVEGVELVIVDVRRDADVIISFKLLGPGGPIWGVIGEFRYVKYPGTDVFRWARITVYVAYYAHPDDVENIIAHELGHALGLRHSNYRYDLMYPTYYPGAPNVPSTLNVYGIAAAFGWMDDAMDPFDYEVPSSVSVSSADDYDFLY